MDENSFLRREDYKKMLASLSPRKWDAYLSNHAVLPTTELNVDLAVAFSSVGTLVDFKRFLRLEQGTDLSEYTPREFFIYCGLLGYGTYLAKSHDAGLLKQLRIWANDSRLHIREGVVQALQVIGQQRASRLLAYANTWAGGSRFEQGVMVAAICDPKFLRNNEICADVLSVLDLITVTILNQNDPDEEGYLELRMLLNRAWGLAAAALPGKAKPMIDRWLNEGKPVINQIIAGNTQGRKLQNVDYEWTGNWLRVMSN